MPESDGPNKSHGPGADLPPRDDIARNLSVTSGEVLLETAAKVQLPGPDIVDTIKDATQPVCSCLSTHPEFHWAIVGGASLVALGSLRSTADVDVVVAPPSSIREARKTFREDKRFSIDSRTLHTHFQASNNVPIEVQFVSFPGTFRRPFNIDTPVQVVGENIRCLHLPALLGSKCESMPQRTSEAKRRSDAFDILFLLQLLRAKKEKLIPADVPNAGVEFQDWFRESGHDSSSFREIGL